MSLQPTAEACLKPWERVVAELQTDAARGLSTQTSHVRRGQYGPNELHVDDDEPMYMKLLEQFQNPLIYLLLASAAISLVIGEYDNAISISLAIVIVATVAFIQEYKSEQSLQALNTLVPHYATVRRDGTTTKLLANDLVPGDICLFAIGDRIPADLRLIEAVDLHVDESALTGETEPVTKKSAPLAVSQSHVPLNVSDRTNICFMGTLVKHGYGVGVIVGTAKSTEFGAVFLLMRDVETKKTPLQQRMDELGTQLSVFSTGVIAVIFLIGWGLQGRSLLETFAISVSLAVAAIPEGLPVVVTVTLALGVLRLAERKAIVKRLPSIETLSCVNVLCIDKTGTLTTNRMTAAYIWLPSMQSPSTVQSIAAAQRGTQLAPDLTQLAACANLCNHARVDAASGAVLGQATDTALFELATRALGSGTDLRASPGAALVAEMPFSSDTKYMTSEWVHPMHSASSPGTSGATCVYMKGALDAVLPQCSGLDATTRDATLRFASELAQQGLRVIGLASGPSRGQLRLLGIVAIHDPPRHGVADAIRRLQNSGVRIIMMTGDSVETATAIARQVGIVGSELAVSGGEVAAAAHGPLNSQFGNSLANAGVLYRMTPAGKLEMVRRLQAMGHIVAMTGDGVNDAPALRLAEIGVSMGAGATDVSKEAADMILVNDDLATLVIAIEEGKTIFLNIRQFLSFQLSTSISALSLVAIATFMGLPNPLNAMQILWINIIMDGPPAQSLGVEPVDRDAVEGTSPRPSESPILTRELLIKVALSALVIVSGTLLTYSLELASGADHEHVTTMTFSVFVMFDMFNAMSCRSLTKSLFGLGFWTNKMFNYAIGFSILGHLGVVYVPLLQRIFQTQPLSLSDWAWILAVSSLVFWMDELRKVVMSRGNGGGGSIRRFLPMFVLRGSGERGRDKKYEMVSGAFEV